ncbi:MAG: hypothetical protein HYZ75_09640 [Elusimicrobia bacterium]|nr:hypothetical protein [Elusimicrobiota bacterium]
MVKLIVLAALLAAAPVRADDRAGLVSLSLSAGAAAPLGGATVRRNAKLGPGCGGAVSLALSESWDAAFSYDSLNMFKTRRLRLEPFLLSATRSWRGAGYWTPAVRFGAGPVIVHQARPRDTDSQTSFAVRTGLGVDYSLTPDLGLAAWADYLFAARSNSDSREVHAATATLAMTFKLGKL